MNPIHARPSGTRLHWLPNIKFHRRKAGDTFLRIRERAPICQAAVTLPPQSQSQPTTNGKPAISLSRDRQAQAQFQATSAATQQDFMGTEGRANEEHYAANTEDETNNLQVTDVADSMTTRIGEQLTGGPSDLTDRPNVTRDISEGETGQH
jgi:hypothetical protein